MALPADVGDYTDFYASVHHATNVGTAVPPRQPAAAELQARAHRLPRPRVVAGPERHGHPPAVGPGRAEVEGDGPVAGARRAGSTTSSRAACSSARATRSAQPVPIGEAGAQHRRASACVNDWSARDVQKWEYQPLGPFLAKSFATSVSPWLVTRGGARALPRPRPSARPEGDPRPLPYLCAEDDRRAGGFDVRLECGCGRRRMREQGLPAARVSASNLRDLYWTPAQMVAHHSEQRLQPPARRPARDRHRLGPAKPSARGCLLELTSGGRAA